MMIGSTSFYGRLFLPPQLYLDNQNQRPSRVASTGQRWRKPNHLCILTNSLAALSLIQHPALLLLEVNIKGDPRQAQCKKGTTQQSFSSPMHPQEWVYTSCFFSSLHGLFRNWVYIYVRIHGEHDCFQILDIGRTHFSIRTVRTLQRIMWEADVTEFQHNQKRVDVVTVCSCPLLYLISSSPQTKPFKQHPLWQRSTSARG